MDKNIAAKRYETLLSLGSGKDRKSVDKDLGSVRKQFQKSKDAYESAKKDFETAQSKLEKAELQMKELKEKLVDLNDCVRVMDLTGAEGYKDRKGQKSYKINGKDYFVDASDVNDVQTVPWREYVKSLQEGDDVDSAEEEIDEEYGDENNLNPQAEVPYTEEDSSNVEDFVSAFASAISKIEKRYS